jgi:monooxygenase
MTPATHSSGPSLSASTSPSSRVDIDYDVLIVGAGLSGVAAAHHLRERCPSARFVILESRSTMGGTWDLFRYPMA